MRGLRHAIGDLAFAHPGPERAAWDKDLERADERVGGLRLFCHALRSFIIKSSWPAALNSASRASPHRCEAGCRCRNWRRGTASDASACARWSDSCPTATGSHDRRARRSEEHTSDLQSLMRISYAFFCLKKKT